MMRRVDFLKYERLKSRQLIETLFKEGKTIYLPPLRVIYLPSDLLSNHQVLFAVPKKRVKRAVTRNKLKRRMREAYRLNKYRLTNSTPSYFLIGYIYIGSDEPSDFKTLQEKIVTSLHRLNGFS
ncbi:MAG: ribonuclease P protein component [Bacteroidota bacterium]